MDQKPTTYSDALEIATYKNRLLYEFGSKSLNHISNDGVSNDTLEKILLQLAANSREEESTQITNLKNKVAFLQQKIDVLVNAKVNGNDKPRNNFSCTYCKMTNHKIDFCRKLKNRRNTESNEIFLKNIWHIRQL